MTIRARAPRLQLTIWDLHECIVINENRSNRDVAVPKSLERDESHDRNDAIVTFTRLIQMQSFKSERTRTVRPRRSLTGLTQLHIMKRVESRIIKPATPKLIQKLIKTGKLIGFVIQVDTRICSILSEFTRVLGRFPLLFGYQIEM